MTPAVCLELAGLVATLVAAFVGASWSVHRTAKDLKTQMEPVIRRLEFLLHALEAGGVVTFVHNEAGEITGVVLELRVTGIATPTGSAHLTVTRGTDRPL